VEASRVEWSRVIVAATGLWDRLGCRRGSRPVTSPRPAGWGHAGWGHNPAELLASAEQLLRQICVEGAPARLLGLKALVAELVWEANTGSVRDRRTVGELSPILMRSRETCCLM
jgi:hypothetical protein